MRYIVEGLTRSNDQVRLTVEANTITEAELKVLKAYGLEIVSVNEERVYSQKRWEWMG